jgi:HPt (histidine-containing phosphotransfer) domain-containing protein
MVDYELNELRREFLGEAREKVEEMDATLSFLDTAENVERLAYLAHQLKGSGGSYGYQSISDDAAEIEKAAETLPSTNGTRASLEKKIREHVVSLRAEIEKAATELAGE